MCLLEIYLLGGKYYKFVKQIINCIDNLLCQLAWVCLQLTTYCDLSRVPYICYDFPWFEDIIHCHMQVSLLLGLALSRCSSLSSPVFVPPNKTNIQFEQGRGSAWKPVNNDVASSIIFKSYKSERRKRLLLDLISNLEGTHCFPCRSRTFPKCSKNKKSHTTLPTFIFVLKSTVSFQCRRKSRLYKERSRHYLTKLPLRVDTEGKCSRKWLPRSGSPASPEFSITRRHIIRQN